jgi:predicted ATPase
MLELTDAAPVLVVLTLRADPGSEGHALRLRALTEFGHRLTELALAPLPVDASLALLRSMLPVIDEVAAEEITRRAEGNPLFLEQLLQTLLDGGGFVRRRTWTITTEAAAGLPPALEGLLVSRIDRLPAESRRLAQVAAVAGRSFALDVVCAAARLDDPAGQLVPLLRSEIVRELRRFPEPEYTFTHALLHEATLAGLTRTRLREVHGLLAAAIERTYAGDLDEHLEALARHRAGSGDRAGAIAALRGAIAHAEASGEGERAARLRARLDVLSP